MRCVAPARSFVSKHSLEAIMTFPNDILTPRLRLVAITTALLRLEGAELAEALGARVPDLWPPEHWEPHVFDFLEKQYRETPHTIGWNRYIVTREAPATLIGNVNGFPRTESEAEVGYSILKPWQGQGLATESLRGLLTEILQSAEVRAVSGQTFPHLVGSVRVMEKCGFVPAGSGYEEGTVRYTRQAVQKQGLGNRE
jgi:RimJ/RimL family protein N-acetyltransferase